MGVTGQPVTLIVFPDREEAETARSMLLKAGIGSGIEGRSTGHALVVAGADLARAREFLAREDDEGDTDEGEAAAPRPGPDSLLRTGREANARRAFFASVAALVIGTLLRPLPDRLLVAVPLFLALYAAWLLVDVSRSRERLAGRPRWMAWAASVIAGGTIVLLGLIARGLI